MSTRPIATTLLLFSCLSFILLSPTTATASPSVIINEVAWMGTEANTSDEWLELFNNTDSPIDLSSWTLVSVDGSPAITLSGAIPASGFYLLERSDDSTVLDITADQIYTGPLNDNGETLILKNASAEIIDTANTDGGFWPAGNTNIGRPTMERINPLLADEDHNWATNSGIIKNGHDAHGDPLNGTPKSQNSCYLPPTPTPTSSPTPIPEPTSTPIPTITNTPTPEPSSTPTITPSSAPTLTPNLQSHPFPQPPQFPFKSRTFQKILSLFLSFL